MHLHDPTATALSAALNAKANALISYTRSNIHFRITYNTIDPSGAWTMRWENRFTTGTFTHNQSYAIVDMMTILVKTVAEMTREFAS